MHLKVIKFQLCGKTSCCIEINSEFCSKPSLFYTKTYPYRSPVTKSYKKNEDVFIQLLYAWLYLTNNNFPAFISIEEILDQHIFLNPHTKWNLSTPPRNISNLPLLGTFADFYNQV